MQRPWIGRIYRPRRAGVIVACCILRFRQLSQETAIASDWQPAGNGADAPGIPDFLHRNINHEHHGEMKCRSEA